MADIPLANQSTWHIPQVWKCQPYKDHHSLSSWWLWILRPQRPFSPPLLTVVTPPEVTWKQTHPSGCSVPCHSLTQVPLDVAFSSRLHNSSRSNGLALGAELSDHCRSDTAVSPNRLSGSARRNDQIDWRDTKYLLYIGLYGLWSWAKSTPPRTSSFFDTSDELFRSFAILLEDFKGVGDSPVGQ